jgi:hypothetical protein
MAMGPGIVRLCRIVARHAVISLSALGLTLAGLVLFGVLPALAAAAAVAACPAETPPGRLVRTMGRVWRREIVRANAVGLALLALAAMAAAPLPHTAVSFTRALLLAVAFAGVSGAVTAAALASRTEGGVAALARKLVRAWLERPWMPPLLALAWVLAPLLAFVHPLLALYAAPSLAATATHRLLSRAAPTAPLVPLGQGVPS